MIEIPVQEYFPQAAKVPGSAGHVSPPLMFAYVGSFTTEKRKARGKGISVYRVDPSTGAWTLVQTHNPVANPGFLALDRRQRFLYAAHGDSGEASSYAIDSATGKVELLNRQPTAGDNSPHVAVDPDSRFVILANGPGIAVCPIKEDGTLAPASDTVIPPGETWPVPARAGARRAPAPGAVRYERTLSRLSRQGRGQGAHVPPRQP